MTSTTTQQHAVIFQGYGATPSDHWFGWLAEQLEADGVPTTIPALPSPLKPDPDQWTDAVRATLKTPDERSVVIAHSLGCLTVLRYLCSLEGPWRLGTLVLVSGFVDRLPALPELDAYIGDGFDLAGLSDRIDRIVVIRSDNDPLVPAALTDRLADLLGVQVRVVPEAGHFLAGDGVNALPAALEAVRGE